MTAVDQELENIKATLRGIPGVKSLCTNWPKSFDALPVLLVQQAGESAVAFRDDQEYLTEIEWYVRVFSGVQAATHRALCNAVHAAMDGIGYARTFRWDEGAADVRLTVFRFAKTI